MTARALALLPCLALAACAEPDPDPIPMVEPAPLPPPPADVPRADTIVVEGEPVAIEPAVYESPLGFPLPFIARIPPEFEAESLASGEGDAVVFTLPDLDGASLRLFIPADASMGEAGVAEYAAAVGAPERIRAAPDWSRASFRSSDASDAFVTVHLTRHADRPVLVSTRVPAEWADGIGPHLRYVLDRIRWADTGRLLIDG